MKKVYSRLLLIFTVAAVAIVVWLIMNSTTAMIKDYKEVSRMPQIKPDYTHLFGYRLGQLHLADSVNVFPKIGRKSGPSGVKLLERHAFPLTSGE